jgi:hypothetical protein
MIYSKIVDVANCMVTTDSVTSSQELEPGYLLSCVPSEWFRYQSQLIVLVRDGSREIEYKMDNFMSKTYRVSHGKVHFGIFKMDLTSISITIGLKIILEHLGPITDKDVD